MTILEINNYFYLRGGAERAFFASIAALEARGHRVIPFALAGAKNRPSPWSRYFPAPAARRRGWKRLYNRDVARCLERLIQETKPDVAHIHNIAYQLTPAVIAVLRRHNIPMVQTLHDYQAVSPLPLLYSNGAIAQTRAWGSWIGVVLTRAVKHSLMASAAAVLHTTLDRLFGWTAGVSRFIAPSLFMANMAVGYGLPEDHIRVLAQPQPVHGCSKRARRHPYFLFVGRLSEEKGVLELIRWWKTLPSSHRLVIVGDGPLTAAVRRSVRALSGSRATLYGACEDRAALARLYEGATAVLVPSQWYENAPYVVLEAFSHGTPVIASDIGGIPELVGDDRGWRVEHAASLGWSWAVARAALYPNEVHERGQRAREWLAHEHTPTAYAQRLEAVLGEACACVRTPQWCTAELA